MYNIIDAHCHIFPQGIAVKATTAIGEFYDLPMLQTSGDSDTLKRSMTLCGFSRALVCSTATSDKQVVKINDFIIEECRTHSKFVGFGTMHVKFPDMEEEIERISAGGLRGIKLHADFQETNIDDEALFPLYKKAALMSLPILFHVGDERYDYSRPERLVRVLEKVDGLTAIASHMGGYTRWKDVIRMYKGCESVYFDTSSSLFALDKEEAVHIIRELGAHKFFFGTDFPMWDGEEELSRFISLPLCEDERAMILSENFGRTILTSQQIS